MLKSLFILPGIAVFAVGCGQMSPVESVPSSVVKEVAKDAAPATPKNEALTPFSLFYGEYTTLTFDEKPVVGSIGSEAEPISCDTWTAIANAPISISQKPGIGEIKRAMTNSREYYDAKTKQPIKADSIWIQYGAHETGLGCNGGVDFLAFSDRGTWTTGADSVAYKFNGTLLTKNSKNEFAETQYGIDAQIERLENGNLKVRFKIKLNNDKFQGSFIVKKN